MRIGARGSDLAQFQARWIRDRLLTVGIESEMVIIKTHGDRVQDRPLRELGVQGVFTRELEDALLEDKIDLAVHSFKDMSIAQPAGLAITAITEREDPADMLIINKSAFSSAAGLLPVKQGMVIGTSAVRRQRQMEAFRPDLRVRDLRGNVPTRLRKLSDGLYSAIFLAAAGVNRLGIDLKDFHFQRLDPRSFIPSPGQGALAVEMRENDRQFKLVHKTLHNEESAIATNLERSVLAKLGGGCGLPLGAFAYRVENRWNLHAFWGDRKAGSFWERVQGEHSSGLADQLVSRLEIGIEE